MIQSDALSRRPDHGLDAEHDNEDMVLLPNHLFLNLLDLNMQERILTSKTMDSDIGKILLTLLDDGPNTLRNDLKDWRVKLSTVIMSYTTRIGPTFRRTKPY